MTYHERIRALAEEMRITVTPEKPLSAGDLMRAHIAVKHMTEAVKAALLRNEPDPGNISTINKIINYLTIQGLIPDTVEPVRQPGFYWIRHCGYWIVAEWRRMGTYYWWLIPGSETLYNPAHEGKNIIVNENKLTEPEQEAAKNDSAA